MFIRCIFIFSIFSTQFAIATVDLSHPLTISELVDFALENHPSTRQTWWNARKATAALRLARSSYYPQVSIEANVQNGRDFKFINGPDTSYTILGADTVVTLMLYDFGERQAALNEAKMALLSANWQADWNIQKVLIRVLENAYSTLYAQEILEARTISLSEAEKILEASKELKRVGLHSISDVYTSLTNVYQTKMELIQQKAFLDIQRGKLAASLGLPANTSIVLASLDPLCLPQKQHIDDLISASNYQRADLMAKHALLCESHARMNKVNSSYKPKLSLYGRGGIEKVIHDKANGANYQVILSLEIPLFNGFKNIYDNRFAYADTKILAAELADLQLNISLEVLTYTHLLEAAQEMLPYAQSYLENASNAYQSTLDRYTAGTEAITEVFVAHKQLAEARVRHSEVKMQWLVAIANLAYATGTIGK